ncbi:hypothetical protein C8R44DRAFT_744620 [Mycena epipterygia]|nr:hypothetical protein C8R44DRAFT_744620 [Mycena epipterygia]
MAEEENSLVDTLAALRHAHIDSADFKTSRARISELIEGRGEIAAAYFLLQERMLTLERAHAALTKEHNELLADYATMTKESSAVLVKETHRDTLSIFSYPTPRVVREYKNELEKIVDLSYLNNYPADVPEPKILFDLFGTLLDIQYYSGIHYSRVDPQHLNLQELSAMEDYDNDTRPPVQPLDYSGASRAEFFEAQLSRDILFCFLTDSVQALKVTQLENTNLRAEIRTLRDENSQLLAATSKKRRGQLDDKQREYQGQMTSWSKRFLLTRALFVDINMFCPKPPELDPANFNFAKDFIREHGDTRSTILNTIRKALPAILKGLDINVDLLTTAGADRSNTAVLLSLLKFPTDRKPTLYAPILFPGHTQNMTELFTGPVVKKVHRLMYYGPGSLSPGSKPAANSSGVKLGLKEVTASSIAAAATLTRFVLSTDKEWASKGAISGTEWEQDYCTYQKLLTSNGHLPHVKNIIKTIRDFVFAGVKIPSGSAPADLDDGTEDDIIDAMRRFELGTDTTPSDPANNDDVDAGATAHNVAAHPVHEPVVVGDQHAPGMPDEPETAATAAKRGKNRGVGQSWRYTYYKVWSDVIKTHT